MTVTLTADGCARAIIAACQIYDADPLRWAEVKRGPSRSALIAAAVAVEKITGQPRSVIATVFGCQPNSMGQAERNANPPFSAAIAAAWSAFDAPASTDARELEIAVLALPAPALPVTPEPTKVAIDHTAAIRAAMDRRRAAGFTVVGVEKDRAQLKAGEGGCHWPKGAPAGAQADPTCHQVAVQGRLFCVGHCQALGQKDTPVDLAAPVMPSRYIDRSAR